MTEADLAGLRVVITRSVDQGRPLRTAIEEAGGTVIDLPLIAIDEASDGGAARRDAVSSLEVDDWLVVLSPNGADKILDDGLAAGACRLAVVGPSTARRFVAGGWQPDIAPDEATSAGLLEAFARVPVGSAVIAQAADGRTELADGLAGAGWDVRVVEAYRNIEPDVDPDTARRARTSSDVVVFASPSAVQRYAHRVGRTPPVAVCFGPVTAGAATGAGFDTTAVTTPTTEAVLAELGRIAQR